MLFTQKRASDLIEVLGERPNKIQKKKKSDP